MLGEPTVVAAKPGEKMGIDGQATGALVEATSNPISCPLVLQCGSCRTIVGDTCTIVDLNPELRTVTLERMGQGAVVDENLHTSMSGMDYGSTYHLISCTKCQTALGRMYRTTSPDLDLWRGQYTFSSDLLAFYELSGHIQPPATNANASVSGCDGKPSAPEVCSLTGSIEISKLQKFCLYLYDRMRYLEETLDNRKDTIGENNGVANGAIDKNTTNRDATKQQSSIERPPRKTGNPVGRPRKKVLTLSHEIAPLPSPKTTLTERITTAPNLNGISASASADAAAPLVSDIPVAPISDANGQTGKIKRGRGRPRKYFPAPLVPPPPPHHPTNPQTMEQDSRPNVS